MAVDLTVSEEEMEESNSAPSLREGYIGPVDLQFIELDKVGDDETPVIRFSFECQDEEHIGQTFDHLEWPITEDDIETVDSNGVSNAEIELRRLVHMLPRLLAVDEQTVRENIVRFQGETTSEAWESLRKRVYQAYEKFGPSGEVENGNVHAKVFARERNGYVNANFGKYPGFLRVVGEDPKLEFTNWERQRNREAQQFLQEEPDGDDDFMAEDEDDFDFDDAEF